MKRIISILLVSVLLVGCAFSLASCGKKLNGKYKADVLVGSTTYEFKGSKVFVTFEFLGQEKTVEGKYKIAENDDGELEITITFPEEEKDAEKYSGTFSFAEGKEGDTKYIKIGGIKLVKVEK